MIHSFHIVPGYGNIRSSIVARVSRERTTINMLISSDSSGVNGDDAASVAVPGSLALVTTDLCINGVHTPTEWSPYQRGAWAAGRALSDIAAMGGRPRAVVAALSIPDGEWDDVGDITRGIRERARASGCDLVGGDLSSAASAHPSAPFTICITCIGTPPAAGPRLMSDARAGDLLVVTGTMGRAAAGSAEIPHRIEAATRLAGLCRAMTDISDGIVEEVHTMADRSGLHLTLDLDAIPVDQQLMALADVDDHTLLAATWGDDYELLLSIDPDHLGPAQDAVADLNIPLTAVGSCADGSGVTMVRNGRELTHTIRGFAH